MVKILKCFFLSICCFIYSICVAQSDANNYFDLGKSYLSNGENHLALEAFNQAILINKNFAKAYTERAKLKMALHKYDEAFADHNKALEINSEFASHQDYAQAISLKEDTKGFVYFYNDCIGAATILSDSSLANLYTCQQDQFYDTTHYQGKAYNKFLSGDYRQSETDALNLLHFDSLNIYANYLLGTLNERKGNYELAIIFFSKAIELDSSFYLNYYRRAVVYKKMKKFDLAISDLYRAEKSHQSNELVYYNRAVIYMMQKNWSKTLRDLNKAIKINPKFSNAYFNRGFVKKQLKDVKGALEDYNTYIKYNPSDPLAYINRGNLHMATEKFLLAIDDYNTAIDLNKNMDIAYLNRGNSYIINGNTADGCQDLLKAIELGNTQAKIKKMLYCD